MVSDVQIYTRRSVIVHQYLCGVAKMWLVVEYWITMTDPQNSR